MSLACHRNNLRKSRVSDVSAKILARMSVSALWNASFMAQTVVTKVIGRCSQQRFTVDDFVDHT